MSSFALSNLAAQTRAVHQSRGVGLFKRRWMHNVLKRQGIQMPALSPFMTEGTVTRWLKKEGEAFGAGDILLQIENDVGMVDVEASCPGIIGKILTPDGTTNVPVESFIAIVAKDASELAAIQNQSLAPTPPPFTHTPSPPSASLSPRMPDLKLPLMSPRTPTMSPRTPSLFEMHTMGYGHRSAHIGGPRGSMLNSPSISLDEAPKSPRAPREESNCNTPVTSRPPQSAADIAYYPKTATTEDGQLDGATIRRMILANLSAARPTELEEFA
ncbi:hypothetical protein H1R20_g7001, partial [Candolleomyces eurysporus]